MKKIVCKFKSNGQNVTKTAIVSDDLSTLSKSKKNQADFFVDFLPEDHAWGIHFSEHDTLAYEVEFKTDKDGNKTLKPVKAITWECEDCSVITDVQRLKIEVIGL